MIVDSWRRMLCRFLGVSLKLQNVWYFSHSDYCRMVALLWCWLLSVEEVRWWNCYYTAIKPQSMKKTRYIGISINLSFLQKAIRMCWKLGSKKEVKLNRQKKKQLCWNLWLCLRHVFNDTMMCLWVFKTSTGVFRGNRTPSVQVPLSQTSWNTCVATWLADHTHVSRY